jgi:hypothetical protein
MRPNEYIASIIDTEAGLQNVPEGSRFAAIMRIIARI